MVDEYACVYVCIVGSQFDYNSGATHLKLNRPPPPKKITHYKKRLKLGTTIRVTTVSRKVRKNIVKSCN